MKQYVIIEGQLVAKKDASISIFDLAVSRGYGIFDFFKTVHGRPIWLEDHLDRFYFSAAEMFMPVPERGDLKLLVQQLMNKNNLPNSGIRISLTGGISADGYSVTKPGLLISQEPFVYDKNTFETGTRLVTYEHQRQLAHVKTIDYLQAIRLRQYVKQKGADELLYHAQSFVLECPRSNIFIVTNDHEIITPSHNILHGVTRKKILEGTGITAREAMIRKEELAAAKEIFITSTTKLVLPVLNIDGEDIGDGKPGEITRWVWKQLLEAQGI